MKNEIDILLEKYFEGQTDLREEKKLKEYFSTSGVSPEHKSYVSLFETLEREGNATFNEPLKPASRIRKRLSFRIISISAAAAVLALVLILSSENKTEDTYAMINGERITEPQFIREYTLAQLEKPYKILNKSLASLEKIEKIKTSIDSGISSIENVKETIETVNEKLKFINHEKINGTYYQLDCDNRYN